MQVSQQPAPLHITHDVFHRGKRTFGGWVVTHGQPDTGHQLVDQHQHCQGAEEIPDVEVLGSVILRQVFVPGVDDWQTLIYPINQFLHHAASGSRPMVMVASSSNRYGGTSRFNGAGWPEKTRPDRSNLEP